MAHTKYEPDYFAVARERIAKAAMDAQLIAANDNQQAVSSESETKNYQVA